MIKLIQELKSSENPVSKNLQKLCYELSLKLICDQKQLHREKFRNIWKK